MVGWFSGEKLIVYSIFSQLVGAKGLQNIDLSSGNNNVL